MSCICVLFLPACLEEGGMGSEVLRVKSVFVITSVHKMPENVRVTGSSVYDGEE